jgi:hypothetical protein
MKIKVFGIGTFEDIGIKSRSLVYNYWFSFLRRCYSEKALLVDSQYQDSYVCEEWIIFKNFVKWFEQNYNPETMQGWHLDKDILFKGNKVYSPETCCFVPQEINKLFTKRQNNRGSFPIGVFKLKNRYIAQCSTNKKSRHLGSFKTVEEAFKAYKIAKELYIKEIADKWRGQITERVYEALYKYQVEITD